jgi:hypothetical protein
MVAYATKAAFRKFGESVDNLKCSNVLKFTHRISKHRYPEKFIAEQLKM